MRRSKKEKGKGREKERGRPAISDPLGASRSQPVEIIGNAPRNLLPSDHAAVAAARKARGMENPVMSGAIPPPVPPKPEAQGRSPSRPPRPDERQRTGPWNPVFPTKPRTDPGWPFPSPPASSPPKSSPPKTSPPKAGPSRGRAPPETRSPRQSGSTVFESDSDRASAHELLTTAKGKHRPPDFTRLMESQPVQNRIQTGGYFRKDGGWRTMLDNYMDADGLNYLHFSDDEEKGKRWWKRSKSKDAGYSTADESDRGRSKKKDKGKGKKR